MGKVHIQGVFSLWLLLSSLLTGCYPVGPVPVDANQRGIVAVGSDAGGERAALRPDAISVGQNSVVVDVTAPTSPRTKSSSVSRMSYSGGSLSAPRLSEGESSDGGEENGGD